MFTFNPIENNAMIVGRASAGISNRNFYRAASCNLWPSEQLGANAAMVADHETTKDLQ